MKALAGFLVPRDWLHLVGGIVLTVIVFEFEVVTLLLLTGMLNSTQLLVSTGIAGLAAVPLIFVFLRVIASQKQAQARLHHMANTDHLTQLPNRRAFFDRSAVALERTDCTVILLDVDHFKEVNDTFGHLQGDTCLTDVAQLIREVAPTGAVLGRLGGEEFAILLDDPDQHAVEALVARLTHGVALQRDCEKAPRVTLSAGIARVAKGADIVTGLAAADRALYAAKALGRAQAQWAEAEQAGLVSPA